jgi:hypothetical protein
VGRAISGTKQLRCEVCPPGKVQASRAATSCVDCLAGYFQNSEEATACLICPAGTRSGGAGRSSCDVCQVGHSLSLLFFPRAQLTGRIVRCCSLARSARRTPR